MAALLGVALSYAALLTTTGVAAPDAADNTLCVRGADACGLMAAVAAAHGQEAGVEAIYATPAEVDCRVVAQPSGAARFAERPLLSGDCDSVVLDLRYRVSRSPDSERPSGALRSDRARRTVRSAATATGLPSDAGALLSTASVPPMALYAGHDSVPPATATTMRAWTIPLVTRTLDPPDRPPRV